jgi:hypothetical protein
MMIGGSKIKTDVDLGLAIVLLDQPCEDGIRPIPPETEATVIRIRVFPGTHVEPYTVLMNLVDPEL